MRATGFRGTRITFRPQPGELEDSGALPVGCCRRGYDYGREDKR